MKILLTTDWYRPVVNGVVTSVVNLTEGLRARGHEVRILTLSDSLCSYREGAVTRIGSIGVGVFYPDARIRAAWGGELVQELIDWKPDIVHSQCEFSTFSFAKRIARACHCPLLHTYHTVYENFTHYFSPNLRVGRFLAARFSRRILAQTDGVIVPTEKIRTMLQGYGVTAPISTVPSGLQLQPFLEPMPPDTRTALRQQLGFREQELVLVSVGRLAKEKNLEELLALLFAAPENVKLLLVGDGPYRQHLENMVHRYGMEARVVFTGMVAPERVAAYYKAGDVFVSASRSETQGLTYIEAMACGLPLLCRRDACLRGVLRPGETGFSYQTILEFMAFLRALELPFRRERLGKTARQIARERFTETGFAQAVLQVYQQALCRPERRGAVA